MKHQYGKVYSLQRNRVRLAWILILPALLLRFFTAFYPMLMTFLYSFMDYNLMQGTKAFAGFSNFVRMAGDINFMESLEFTFVFTGLSILLHIVFGILIALALNMEFAGQRLLRSIVLIPWAIPAIVAGIAAQWLFNDEFGMINDLLFRFMNIRPLWLVTKTSARIVVILTDVWKDTPFFAILILAALQGINGEVYEAARIDGARSWKIFWSITLPFITPTLATLTIFFSLWRLASFDLVYALTKGGPGTATSLLSYRIYMVAFNHLDFGYASGISIALFLVMGVIAAVGFSIQRRIDY